MHLYALLAANDFDVIKLIAGLVVGVIWVLNHLFGAKQGGKVPPLAKRPAAPRRVNPNPPVGQAAPQRPRASDSLSAEIEQFLKDAAQRKRDKGRREPAAKAGPARPQAPPQAEVPVDVEALEPLTGEAVSEAVNRHLDTRQFAARASNLSEDMKRADVQREQHFKKAFDHKLGRLTDTSHTQAEVPVPLASDRHGNIPAVVLGNLLSKPENLRQAVVLNEILSRPEHRW